MNLHQLPRQKIKVLFCYLMYVTKVDPDASQMRPLTISGPIWLLETMNKTLAMSEIHTPVFWENPCQIGLQGGCMLWCLFAWNKHIDVCVCMYVCLSIYLPIYLSTHLPIYPSTHLPIYPSTHLPIYPSTHLPIYPSTHLPIYLSTYLPIYL